MNPKAKGKFRLLQVATIFGLAALPCAAWAQFTVVTNNGAVTITGYTGSSNVITIPSVTNTYPVTAISNKAFFNGQGLYTHLASITIPGSVTNIGYEAFDNCIGLTNLNLGTGVITIGSNAFQSCTGLTNIAIPASVTNIGSQAFVGCANLTAINVDPADTSYSSPGGILFDASQATLIAYPGARTGNVVVSNSVTSIASWAFLNCAGITNIAIPASVTNIGFEAFKSCARLSALAVDAGNPAFSSSNGVLFDLPAATLLQFPQNKAGSYAIPNGVTTIATEAFYSCTNLTNVTIPGGVTSIGSSAFGICTKLASTTFPPSLTNIGASAFYDCSSLTTPIALGDNVRNIGDFAFQLCSGVGSITIGNGLSSIGNDVFYFCSGVTNFSLGANITSIGSSAFYNCANLVNISLPVGLTNIGSYAFFDCSKLASITIPNGVTSIGAVVFENCYALKRVVLPPSLTSIGINAFLYTGLTNIVIPVTVTAINANAFANCTGLKTVFFEGNAPATLAASAFSGSGISTVYVLPGTSGWPGFTTTTGLSVTNWFLPSPTILNFGPGFGFQTNNFGFSISWATNHSVIVDVCTNLAQGTWTPMATNNPSNGAFYFGDANWTNSSSRFYRIRTPNP